MRRHHTIHSIGAMMQCFSISGFHKRFVAGLCVSLLFSLCAAAPKMMAQTVFPRPDTPPNYVGYRHVDECQAAVDRLDKAAERARGVWDDTARFDPTEKYRPHAPTAVAAARACLSHMTVDTLPIDSRVWQTWSDMLAMVGRDADVQTLYTRIQAAQPGLDTLLHLSSLLGLYRTARPIRLPEALEIWERLVKAEAVDTFTPHLWVQVGRTLFWDLWNTGDTAAARQVGGRILASFEQLPIDQRTRIPGGNSYSKDLYERLYEREWQDSLARSTAAYRRFVIHEHERFYGDSLRYNAHQYLGVTAPEIKGNAEFRSMTSGATTSLATQGAISDQYLRLPDDQHTRRPVPGRVNLVAFLQGCHSLTVSVNQMFGRYNSGPCMRQMSALRRLKQRFPALELTIVTNTFGSIGNAPPFANPSDEADTLAKYFLGFHHLPGTLVVSYTEFWRMPGLDNRRMDGDDENWQRWREAAAKGRSLDKQDVVAVDETGAVFHVGNLGGLDGLKNKNDDELILEKKLEAVFRRVQSSPAAPNTTHTVAPQPDPTSRPAPPETTQTQSR